MEEKKKLRKQNKLIVLAVIFILLIMANVNMLVLAVNYNTNLEIYFVIMAFVLSIMLFLTVASLLLGLKK